MGPAQRHNGRRHIRRHGAGLAVRRSRRILKTRPARAMIALDPFVAGFPADPIGPAKRRKAQIAPQSPRHETHTLIVHVADFPWHRQVLPASDWNMSTM